MVCCGIVGRGACIKSFSFSVLLVLVFPFLSSREFSGPTSQGPMGISAKEGANLRDQKTDGANAMIC